MRAGNRTHSSAKRCWHSPSNCPLGQPSRTFLTNLLFLWGALTENVRFRTIVYHNWYYALRVTTIQSLNHWITGFVILLPSFGTRSSFEGTSHLRIVHYRQTAIVHYRSRTPMHTGQPLPLWMYVTTAVDPP